MSDRLFVIYDARAGGGEVDNALVLSTTRSLREARRAGRQTFGEAAIYSYRVKRRDGDMDELIDEQFVEFVSNDVERGRPAELPETEQASWPEQP